MNSIELQSSAKINLSIDVLGKREDGYHEVEMIMQEIELSDLIRIEKRPANIEVSCSLPYLPCDEGNLAYSAARLFFETSGIAGGAGITIEKQIPVSAGLGGGSSNGAYVLSGLNKLYDAGFDSRALMDMSARLGSDAPFFINGGTALSTGRGEKIEKIETETVFELLLLKPDIAVSTREIYSRLDLKQITNRPLTKNLVEALKSNDSITVARNLVNVLEAVTFSIYPMIRDIKEKLLELGAISALMSGSGSSVFGIFHNRYAALQAAERFTDQRLQKFVTRTRVLT